MKALNMVLGIALALFATAQALQAAGLIGDGPSILLLFWVVVGVIGATWCFKDAAARK